MSKYLYLVTPRMNRTSGWTCQYYIHPKYMEVHLESVQTRANSDFSLILNRQRNLLIQTRKKGELDLQKIVSTNGYIYEQATVKKSII